MLYNRVDMRGGAPPRMKIAHSGGLMAIFMEALLFKTKYRWNNL
jgi:hypothetical protein